jgi:nucleotide-binding universal stress UspA family protein
MYDTILVTLDGTPTDRAIIEHVQHLAKLAHSRVVLLHVADGWAARTYGPDAVSPEIAEDTAYLEQIIQWTEQNPCDLVAMTTHGHRGLADLFLGTTITKVRHSVKVPVLLVKGK